MESNRGGILPLIIGVAAMIIGVVSVLTCFGKNPAIINTGAGNGANAVVSVLVFFTGLYIFKFRNTLAAVLFVLLFTSLTYYGNYKVDGQRAVQVVAAAGGAVVTAAGSAVTAAGGAAIDSVSNANVGNSVASSGGLKGGHRWLTQKELNWCAAKKSKSKGCVTNQCAVNNCGAKGK